MPFASTLDIPYVSSIADESGFIRMSDDTQDFGILDRQVHEIKFGATSYPLRKTTRLRLLPDVASGRYKYLMQGIPTIIGSGITPQAALDDFSEVFHCRFQELLAKRPFELDEAERRQWYELGGTVDVESYRRSVPIRVRQFGQVIDARPGYRSVRWEGLKGRHRVDLSNYPDDFASYKAGQPFEAIVLLDSQNGKMQRVVHVARRSQPKVLSDAESNTRVNGLKSSEDQPAFTPRLG
jgi:hypothetical protein